MKRTAVLVSILLVAGIVGTLALASRLTYGHAAVTFEDGTALTVEVASTPKARALGLGARDALGADAGMLFTFDQPGTYGFWMKDMRFPIDIIWLRDGEVVDLNPDVPVGSGDSLPSYAPSVPVNQVLETNAGFVKGHEITVGDRLDIREANR